MMCHIQEVHMKIGKYHTITSKFPLSALTYTDDSPFDAKYDFEYDGQAFEKLDETYPTMYRAILSDDDYDYVEDADMIKKLDEASAHIKS